MTAPEQNKVKGAGLSPQQRAQKIKDLLIARKAPPLEEGDEVRKLSSNSTLAVIITTDDLFRAGGFTDTPTWEQYAVICGAIACLADAATQFTGLPREGVPYMVGDSIHFLFSGPDRSKWPETKNTYNFAVTQYQHMIQSPASNPVVDELGRRFYNYLAAGEDADLQAMKDQFRALITTPDVAPVIRDKAGSANAG